MPLRCCQLPRWSFRAFALRDTTLDGTALEVLLEERRSARFRRDHHRRRMQARLSSHVQDLRRDKVQPVFLLDEAHLLHPDMLAHLDILMNYEW
jgi:hypothetical protein